MSTIDFFKQLTFGLPILEFQHLLNIGVGPARVYMHDAVIDMMKFQRERVANLSGMSINDLHDIDPLGGMDMDNDSIEFEDQLRMEGML